MTIKISSHGDIERNSLERRVQTVHEGVRRLHPTLKPCGTEENSVFVIDEDTSEVWKFDYRLISDGREEGAVEFKNAQPVKVELDLERRREKIAQDVAKALADNDLKALDQAEEEIEELTRDELRAESNVSSSTGVTIRDIVEIVLDEVNDWKIPYLIGKAGLRFGAHSKFRNRVVSLRNHGMNQRGINEVLSLVQIVKARTKFLTEVADSDEFKKQLDAVVASKDDDEELKALKKLYDKNGGEIVSMSDQEIMDSLKACLKDEEEAAQAYVKIKSYANNQCKQEVDKVHHVATEGYTLPLGAALEDLSTVIDIGLLEQVDIVELCDVISKIMANDREIGLLSHAKTETLRGVEEALKTMIKSKGRDIGAVQVAVNEVAQIAPTVFRMGEINNEFPLGMWAAPSPDLQYLHQFNEDPMVNPVQIKRADAEKLGRAWWMNINPDGTKIGVTREFEDRVSSHLTEFKTVSVTDQKLMGGVPGYAVIVDCVGMPEVSIRKNNREVASIKPEKDRYVVEGSDTTAKEIAKRVMTSLSVSWANERFDESFIQDVKQVAQETRRSLEQDPHADDTLADVDPEHPNKNDRDKNNDRGDEKKEDEEEKKKQNGEEEGGKKKKQNGDED